MENNKTKRVYISGLLPLVGSRYEGMSIYQEHLNIAESAILQAGYRLVNMAELELGLGQRNGRTQDIHQNVSLAMLRCCDVIYMVKGWERSEIALEEKRIADELGLEVLFEPQQRGKEAA